MPKRPKIMIIEETSKVRTPRILSSIAIEMVSISGKV
jgi:hypothetical protein